MAFPQADVKTDIYMSPPKVPKSFAIPDLSNFIDRFTHTYTLMKNLYGLKDASCTWNTHLKTGLFKRGWKQSGIDKCLFSKGKLLFIIYVDDACIISPSKSAIINEISSLQQNEGDFHYYLGTCFAQDNNGSVTLTQPRMIEHALSIVGLHGTNLHIKRHDTPSVDVLVTSTKAKLCLQKWNYRSAIGCVSYIQAMVRSNITFAV